MVLVRELNETNAQPQLAINDKSGLYIYFSFPERTTLSFIEYLLMINKWIC